jgi:hypothetical protein
MTSTRCLFATRFASAPLRAPALPLSLSLSLSLSLAHAHTPRMHVHFIKNGPRIPLLHPPSVTPEDYDDGLF